MPEKPKINRWWDAAAPDPLKAMTVPSTVVAPAEPVKEEIEEIDFFFLGDLGTQLTLREGDKFESIDQTYVCTPLGRNESITIERRNLLYLTRRKRTITKAAPKPANS